MKVPAVAWIGSIALGLTAAGLDAGEPPSTTTAASTDVVGEAFGAPVTAEEFAHYERMVQLFTRGEHTQGYSEPEIRQEAWQNLVLAREANRLGVGRDRAQLDEAIRPLIAQWGGEFRGPRYAEWVRATFEEDVDTFERQAADLARGNLLIQQQVPEPAISDEEVTSQFLRDYNTLELEYVRFETEARAEAFQLDVQRDPAQWKPAYDRARAADGQRGAGWINMMTIGALAELWRIPADDLQRLLQIDEGRWVVCRHLYGPVVVRLLGKQTASPADLDEARRTQYRQRLAAAKRQQAIRAYLDWLLRTAGYRDFRFP